MTERSPFLPVLIIPGFMSSRLEVVDSESTPSWIGKSIWLNLLALGFQAVHFGGAVRHEVSNDEEGMSQYHEYRNLWIKHMTLLDDMQNEREGIKVRPILGLKGVDYLTTGPMKEQLSYVFGPVIQALKEVGYQEGINLDAAPYDWRLTPQKMQQRDDYYSRTIDQIQQLYEQNNNIPVLLLCHSMGCKQGHYLLNFAKKNKGQDWLDKYIHTYAPIGGPHLGAPKSLRAVITGDKMSLDAFLSHEEALILGRSLGSGPWLCPGILPDGVPPTAFLRKEGYLEVQISDANISALFSPDVPRPKKIKVAVLYGDRSISSQTYSYSASGNYSSRDKFIFAIDHDETRGSPATTKTLTVVFSEPGIAAAKKKEKQKKSCLWKLFCCLMLPIRLLLCLPCINMIFQILIGTAILSVDVLTRAAGGTAVFASTEKIPIESTEFPPFEKTIQVALLNMKDTSPSIWNCFKPRKQTKITLKLVYTTSHMKPQTSTNLSICTPLRTDMCISLRSPRNKNVQFEAFTGSQAMQVAGAQKSVDVTDDVYEKDILGPRDRSSIDPPPVKNVLAVYGINVETEVSVAYKRKKACIIQEGDIYDVFCIDKSSRLCDTSNGYVIKDGVIYETPKTEQKLVNVGSQSTKKCCGDGSVPYWSLQHVQSWSTHCNVIVKELDNAEHREILADKRFHETLIEYVTRTEAGVISIV